MTTVGEQWLIDEANKQAELEHKKAKVMKIVDFCYEFFAYNPEEYAKVRTMFGICQPASNSKLLVSKVIDEFHMSPDDAMAVLDEIKIYPPKYDNVIKDILYANRTPEQMKADARRTRLVTLWVVLIGIGAYYKFIAPLLS